MEKIKLTDRFVVSRKAAAAGRRDDYHDSLVPGLALRVTDRAAKSFVLHGRFPANPGHFTRRRIGSYPALSLDEARTVARAWQRLIERGVDPAEEEERQRSAARLVQENIVSAVTEAFIAKKLPGERKADDVAREIRSDFVQAVLERDRRAGRIVGDKPITEVTADDILEIIQAKKETAPAQARNLLGHIKRFFKWARSQRIYGLTVNPCAELTPMEIIGERASSDRVLSDDELVAFWSAASGFSYPVREVYQLLALTALRLNEAADAKWEEFDFRNREWTIPAARMKGKNSKARPHVVPLTDEMLKILGLLPELKQGPFLFSTTDGEKAVWIGSKIKAKLDERMLDSLREIVSGRGGDPASIEISPWVNHDIRRTVRTNLSPLKNALGVGLADEVKEAVIAHVRPGIKGTYDRYQYLDEKREALTLWSDRLFLILDEYKPRERTAEPTA